jgi:hypothetical protein
MKCVIIPNEVPTIDDEVDMSNLNFDVPEEKKKKYALTFLRNIGTNPKLNFDNCSYEDKEEYLKLYLSTDIEISFKIFSDTWTNILTFYIDDNIYLDSILTKDEIIKFINNNKSFINKVRRLINSLPYYSMETYNTNGDYIDMSNVPFIEDDEIKIVNIYYLAGYNTFSLLLTEYDKSIEGQEPGYFSLFNDKDNQYYLHRIIENLPFYNILSLLFAPQEVQKDAITEFVKIVSQESEVQVNEDNC